MAENPSMAISCQPLLDRLTYLMSDTGSLIKFNELNNLKSKVEFCEQNELNFRKKGENYSINISNEIDNLLQAFYKESSNYLKNEEEGKRLFNLGKKAFMKKKDPEACKFYTDGLRYTPKDSPLLPFLYGNRSAALFQSKNYKECTEDIKRAKLYGYPHELQFKLHKRETEALIHLGNCKQAEEALEKTKEYLNGSEPKNCSVEELETKISEMHMKDEKRIENSEETPSKPQLFKQDGENYISGALEIRLNEEYGRHIRAANNIPKGSALFREKPYASILLPEFYTTHCQLCYKIPNNPIPCPDCTEVLWCNEECLCSGRSFHQYECGNLLTLRSVGIAHLAARITLVAGWSLCRQQLCNDEQTASGLNSTNEENEKREREIYLSLNPKFRYKAVYDLISHFDDAQAEDQFQYCLAGILLARVLITKTGFLNPVDEPKENWTLVKTLQEAEDIEVELASLLVHHISQLVSNSHAITQIQSISLGQNLRVFEYGQERIATAIYPLASLMNHSCKPSIINSFESDVLIIHSIRDIGEGEQVFNCYGPHINRHDREDRRTKLERQYFFNCKCEGCTDAEALMREASWSGLRCPLCREGIAQSSTELHHLTKGKIIHCLTCRRSLPLSDELLQKYSDVNSLYEDGKHDLEKGNLEDSEKMLKEALNLGEELFTDKNEFLCCIRDTLARCYAALGKYEKALQELSVCQGVIEDRYDVNGVEVAYELLKYLDVAQLVAVKDMRLADSIALARGRANDIFRLHYGTEWHKFLNISSF